MFAGRVVLAGSQRIADGGWTVPAHRVTRQRAFPVNHRLDRSDAVEQPAPGGAPLDPTFATRMRHRFGQDFSRVRVHSDPAAAAAAGRLGATGFTIGEHIHLGADAPPPGTDQGDRLLTHELAHVVQQTGGSSLDDVAAELEADEVAAGVRGLAPAHGARRPRIQRQVRAGRISAEDVETIVENRNPESVPRRLAECQAGRQRDVKIFPFRPTRFGSATLSAHADGDEIVVKLPVHVHSNDDFRAQTRTLPVSAFTSGLRLPRYEIVRVHVYDPPWYKLNITGSTEGDRESEFCIPAEGLLQVSDASERGDFAEHRGHRCGGAVVRRARQGYWCRHTGGGAGRP
jgi:hypothetical protein